MPIFGRTAVPSGPVILPGSISEQLSLTGNEITDARRVEGFGVPVVGHSYDGRSGDSSFGVWESSQNYCPNGGFETNLAGYSSYQGGTLTRDNSHPEFGGWAMKVVTPGVTAANGGEGFTGPLSGVGTAAVGETWVLSAWVWANGGEQVALIVEEADASGTFLTVGQTNYVLAAGKQRLSTVRVLQNRSANQVKIDIRTVTTPQAITIWVDGVNYEKRRTAVALTPSGNEVTDTTRAAVLGVGSSGQMMDGRVSDSSFGIRRAATNAFRHGQCDAVTDWTGSAVGSTDATTPPPFSTQSIKCVADGTAANQNMTANTATGQAIAAGVVCVGAIYFKGVAGQAYQHRMRVANTDASVTFGTFTNFTATGAFQLLTPTSLAVAAGKTGDKVVVDVAINGTRAETFWVAHAMIEIGQSVVAPYVATTGSSTATHAASTVTGPASLLSVTQGWVAVRFRPGYAAALAPNALPTMFRWWDGSTANKIIGYFDRANTRFVVEIDQTGGNASAPAAATAFNAGDLETVIFAWDSVAQVVKISVNGAAFVTAAWTHPLTAGAMQATFTIGNGDNVSDGDFLWVMTGTGTLANVDATTLSGLGNTDPNIDATLGAAAKATSMWAAVTAAYVTPRATLQIATPYVHTDGAAATRPAAGPTAPVALFGGAPGQLWIACRVRIAAPYNYDPQFRDFFRWSGSNGSDTLCIQYRGDTQVFEVSRRSLGFATNDIDSATQSFAPDTLVTLVAVWEPTRIGLSINGAAFTYQANANTAMGTLGSVFDIGWNATNNRWSDCDVLWMGGGMGTLTSADAATLHAKLAAGTDPVFSDLPSSALATFAMSMEDASFLVGSTAFQLTSDTKYVSRVTQPSPTAKLSKISAYIDGMGSGGGNQVARGVVYDAASGALLAASGEVVVASGQAAGWVDFSFSPVDLPQGDYLIGLHAGPFTNVIRLYGSDPYGLGSKWNADTYADGASVTFGAATVDTFGFAIYATDFAGYAPPPSEADIYFSRLPFADAQQALGQGGPDAKTYVADVGWHDTFQDPETGSVALVRDGSGLESLLGERIRVITEDGTSVVAYVHNLAAEDSFDWDVSLPRHSFAKIGLLATHSLTCIVEVIV